MRNKITITPRELDLMKEEFILKNRRITPENMLDAFFEKAMLNKPK